MSPPPGQQPTSELCGEHITAAGDTDLATRNGQMRYLMRELGVTRPQAHRLIVAYERERTGDWQISDDTGSRNSGRPMPVMRWLGGAT